MKKVDLKKTDLYCLPTANLIQLYVQGVSGALEVLMKDAIRPNIMQTLEVSLANCYY